MADQSEYRGRLIAVDGSRGKDTSAAAAAVVAALKAKKIECALSRFDASGLFGELAAAARANRHVSARTLTLVYAADLAFRLRWEIRPVLEAGGVVVQCSTALPARPHHCKVRPLGIQTEGSLRWRESDSLISFPRSNLVSMFLTAFLTSTSIKKGPMITAKSKKAMTGKTNAPKIFHANSFVSTAPASSMMGTVTWYPKTLANVSINHSAISSNHTYNATISFVSIFPLC